MTAAHDLAEYRGFVASICAAPAEDTPRLAFADWLEEHGEPERAEFIRVQVELAKLDPFDGWTCKVCSAPASRDPDEFGHVEHGRGCYTQSEDGGGWERIEPYPPWPALAARQQSLFHPHADAWFPVPAGYGLNWGIHLAPAQTSLPCGYVVSRGFVSEVTCTAQDWLTHADSLVWRPEQTVECPEKGCEHGTVGRPKPGAVGGQWLGRMCDRCDGTGRVARPFVPTAHPITRVNLTTWPGETPGWPQWSEMPTGVGPYFAHPWLGVAIYPPPA